MGGPHRSVGDQSATSRASSTTPTPPALPNRALPVVEYRGGGGREGVEQGRRPGRLTALGVVSICVGVLGALLHVWSFSYIPMMMRLTAPPPPPPAPPGPLAPTTPVVSYAGEMRGAERLKRGDREVIVNHLAQRMSLPLDRKIMLRRLLGECGGRVFPSAAAGTLVTARPPIDAKAIDALILDSGRAPAGPDGLRTLGTHYFKTAGGVVLLDNTIARFVPAGAGAGEGVRCEGALVLLPEQQLKRLSAVAIERELDDVRTRLGQRFNALQASVLADHLSRVPQGSSIVDRMERGLPALPDAKLLAGGTLSVEDSLYCWILQNGQLIESPSSQLDPVTGHPRRPPPPPPRKVAMTRGLVWASLTDSVVGTLLAALLVVCGIMTLANAPAAARLHAGWAWLKIASVVAFALPSFWAASAMGQDLAAAPGPGAPAAATSAYGTGLVIGTILGLLLQLVYPIVVLCILRLREVREFYLWHGVGDAGSPAAAASVLAPIVGGSRGKVVVAAAALLLGLSLASYGALAGGIETATPWWATSSARVAISLLGCAAFVAGILSLRTPTRRAAGVAALLLAALLLAPHATAQTTRRADAPVARRAGARAATRPANEVQLKSRLQQLTTNAPRAITERDDLFRAIDGGDVTLYALLNDPTALRLVLRVMREQWVMRRTLTHPPAAHEPIRAALPNLREMLRDDDPGMRWQALELILALGDPGLREMVEHIGGKDEKLSRLGVGAVRKETVAQMSKETRALLESKAPALLDLLLQLQAQPKSPEQHNNAAAHAGALATIRNSPDVWQEFRKRILAPANVDDGIANALFNVYAPAGHGVEPFLDAPAPLEERDDLLLTMAAKGDGATRERVVRHFRHSVQRSTPDDVTRLRRPLASPDATVRAGVIAVMSHAPDWKQLAELVAASPEAKAPAALAVKGASEMRKTRPEDLAQLVEDAVARGSADALRALEVASHAAPPSVEALAKRPLPERLDGAIERAFDQDWLAAQETLLKMLQDPDPAVRQAIAARLGRMSIETSRGIVLRALIDTNLPATLVERVHTTRDGPPPYRLSGVAGPDVAAELTRRDEKTWSRKITWSSTIADPTAVRRTPVAKPAAAPPHPLAPATPWLVIILSVLTLTLAAARLALGSSSAK